MISGAVLKAGFVLLPHFFRDDVRLLLVADMVCTLLIIICSAIT